jgi:hypothetical protein
MRAGVILAIAAAAATSLLGAPPADAAPPSPVVITHDPAFGELVDLRCVAAEQCTALTVDGGVITFNPLAPGQPGSVGAESGGSSLACASADLCMSLGGEPGNPDSGVYPVDGGQAATAFDPTQPLNAVTGSLPSGPVACVSEQRCLAVTAKGMVSFAPLEPAVTSPVPLTLAGDFATGYITCPTASVCVLVSDEGVEQTVDLAAGTATKPLTVPLHRQWLLTGKPTAYVGAPSCPSVTQCTIFDTAGGVVTFDPAAATATTARVVVDPDGGGVNALACPSVTQCTMIDNDQGAVTFDPLAPLPAQRVIIDPTGYELIALQCPTVAQCTLIDANNAQETFDPQAPSTSTPYVAHVAIDGLDDYYNQFSPLIALDAVAGTDVAASTVTSIVVAAPHGLRYRLTTRDPTLTVRADDAPVRYRARLGAGGLTITPAHPTFDLRVRIAGPTLVLTGPLRRALNNEQQPTLVLQVVIRTRGDGTHRLHLLVPLYPPYTSENCGDHAAQELPITTSNPFVCAEGG